MGSKRTHSAMNAASPSTADDDDPVDPSDELVFTALGGGNEVGRSCHIVQYKGKTVMLDAGIHPAYDGLAALPFYDEFDLSTVDILLITHFHMDHAASLPYVLAKTNFAGRVYMTHPTKAIYKWIMQDSVRVQSNQQHAAAAASGGGTDGYVHQLFSEHDILATLPLINTISFNTTHTHAGIKFSAYPAGHVLGACMYLLEIAGLNILFTGDYSREPNRHLIPATLPRGTRVDCLITEATFGISTHVPRLERETALMKSITTILARGGRALLPVFAIGGAQELLLILEDYWRRHADLRRYPIYFASSLARKCMIVYQTYIDAMNDDIKTAFAAGQQQQLQQQAASRSNANNKNNNDTDGEPGPVGGPWDFNYIRSLKSLERFDDVGGCVMLASPGMLQNGVSRALLERWAPDARNGVVITGYSVEGTMAKQIMLEPDAIPAVMTARQRNAASLLGRRAGPVSNAQQTQQDGDQVMVPRRCSVQEFSFAAHVDGQENRAFIEEVGAPVVILVHGEKHNMNRLKSRLLGLQSMKVFSPANCEELRIPFRQDKVARVVGRLASEVSPLSLRLAGKREAGDETEVEEDDLIMSGVLVQNDFKLSLMAPEDLKEYAGLTTTTIVCRQRLTLAAAGVELIRWALEGTFGSVDVPHAVNGNGIKTEGESKRGADEEHTTTFEVMGGAVRVLCRPHGELELEWEGNTANDSIADAVMAVLLAVESSPAAVRQSSSKPHSHSHSPTSRELDDYDAFGDSPVDADPSTKKQAASANGIARGNPLANLSPNEKLSRLFMFLEAQFGEHAISPIARPKLASTTPKEISSTTTSKTPAAVTNGTASAAETTADTGDAREEDDEDAVAREKAEAHELARLHARGIPVPGLEIRVDRAVCRVWLEDLQVECANRTFADRVRAVVERAVETVAPLWE